jgi:phosphohistidine phosphatase
MARDQIGDHLKIRKLTMLSPTRRLTLIRHAKSSWKYPHLHDRERQLNKRGKRDAAMMGKRLRDRGVQPDLIISSPAKRALETVRSIAREIRYSKDRIVVDDMIYEEGAYGVLNLIKGLEGTYKEIMLVGHNPTFSELAASLGNESIGNMPTCSVFCIEFRADTWAKIASVESHLVFYDYPKSGSTVRSETLPKTRREQ